MNLKRESRSQSGFQHGYLVTFDEIQPQTLTALASSIVFFRSRLRNSRSDGVNILGTKEITPFAFRETIKAVAEDLLPPIFEFIAIFPEKLFQSVGLQG